MVEIGIVVRNGCNPNVSVIATARNDGFEPMNKTKHTETRWRAIEGGMVVIDDNDKVYPMPAALGLRVMDAINGIPAEKGVSARLKTAWTADTVTSVMQSKDYAFGNKVFLHPAQLGDLRLRKGDEILVGYTEESEHDKLDLAVEYVRMPKAVTHILLRATNAGRIQQEPAWSPVTSVSSSPLNLLSIQ